MTPFKMDSSYGYKCHVLNYLKGGWRFLHYLKRKWFPRQYFMKNLKFGTFIKVFAAVILCGTIAAPTIFAAVRVVNAYLNDNLKIIFNNKEFIYKDYTGNILDPFLIYDRTYIPLRAIAEKTGVYVDYDAANTKVIVKSENVLLDRAKLVLHYLKYKDYKQLSDVIHPKKGVTFSPYAYIESSALKFTAAQIAELDKNKSKTYVWGTYDGSGNPMKHTFDEYHARFIYNHDFIQAERIGNNSIIQTGNTPDNISKAFPGAKFIEFNFSGFDPQYAGIDWASLRIVFEYYNDNWYVTAIVHDCWTI